MGATRPKVPEGVTVVDHPLVRHKLTRMRDRDTSTRTFRDLTREISHLLCYEVTRDLPLAPVTIQTSLAGEIESEALAGKKLVFAAILRAGTTMAEGMLELVPSARVAHIGLYRNRDARQTVEYYFKAPDDVAERLVIVVDTLLATGGTAVAAVERLKEAGRRDTLRAWLPRRRASMRCRANTPACASGRRRSMTASMGGASSCRAWATRATGCFGTK